MMLSVVTQYENQQASKADPINNYEAFDDDCIGDELLLYLPLCSTKVNKFPKQIPLTIISFVNWLKQLKVKNLHL